jgi:hypothetical protein
LVLRKKDIKEKGDWDFIIIDKRLATSDLMLFL